MVGTIERRLLINYRIDPQILARILPSPFRPQVVNGAGVAGICLIRLGHLRPSGLPAAVGVTSENAAHRVAVEWDGQDGPHHGVYIPRRHTSSRLTVLVGGRWFPGEHRRARFTVTETVSRFNVAFHDLDGTTEVAVSTHLATRLPAHSVFGSLEEASSFFKHAPLGFSATSSQGRLDCIELSCATWQVEPLTVSGALSRDFDDRSIFPAGTISLDSALLMRDISATWLAGPPMSSKTAPALASP
jgi:hypothetical protein